jgi:putative ABC transport system permease protein
LEIWQDVRYGLRSLGKHRRLTVVSVAVLSVGIGAATALFSLAHTVLLRPVPGVENPDQLVRLFRLQDGKQYINFGYPDYVDYRDRNRTLTGLIAEGQIAISLADPATQRIAGAVVSGNYFAVLGVKPAAGRLLTPDDDRIPGAHPVAVISYRLWRESFGRDPGVIGQKLMLNGYAYALIGVASEAFHSLRIGDQTDVWVPMMMQNEAMPRYTGRNFLGLRSAGWMSIYGRLRPGVSLEQARSDIASIALGLERAYPDSNRGRSATVTRDVGLSPDQRQELSRLLILLLTSVAVLLLIACENVANLFLARAASRRREIAVRLAIGAGRWRLIRQLMTESLLLSGIATGFGLLMAPFNMELALKLLGPADVALRAPSSIDGPVLLFAVGLTVVTALLFGLVPALQSSRTDIVTSLKATTPGGWGARRVPRIATMLLAGQVAMSAILLVGAGLVVRTMLHIIAIPAGFSADRVLLAAVDLAIQRYPEAQGKLFCEQLIQRLTAHSDVVSASVSKSEPARDWSDRRPVFLPDQVPPRDALRRNRGLGLQVDANLISPGYFRTLGIALTAGRDFSWSDRDATPLVAIVSERLARRLWPHESAIGKRITAPDLDGPVRPPLEVIGVAADAKYRSILTEPPLLLYEPEMQKYDSYLTIEVRTKSDPAAFAPALRQEIAALDRNLPVYSVRTFSAQVDRSLWQQRSAAMLISVFGLLSLALASIGMYSQLAHSVAARTREIGIRMALGADAPIVRRSIMRQGVALAAIGATAGLLVAVPLVQLLHAFLYGVSAVDPATYVLAWMLLVLLAFLASYFPARKATRVDPMVALRVD